MPARSHSAEWRAWESSKSLGTMAPDLFRRRLSNAASRLLWSGPFYLNVAHRRVYLLSLQGEHRTQAGDLSTVPLMALPGIRNFAS